jgi:hypothetical protein
MPRLQSIIHGLVETARIELYKALLVLEVDEDGQVKDRATPLPPIKWDSIVDNPAEIRTS